MAASEEKQGIESTRLEAFSDAVIAVAITIMVLEIKAPHSGEFSALKEVTPTFLAYILSFTFIGIYWNNHHHMLRAAKTISGSVMWANLHLLFWLSMVPFVTAWVGEHHEDSAPAVTYGAVAVMAALAYTVLFKTIVKANPETNFAQALGHDLKGKLSLGFYVVGTGLAFINPYIAYALFACVTLMWFIPDRRLANL